MKIAKTVSMVAVATVAVSLSVNLAAARDVYDFPAAGDVAVSGRVGLAIDECIRSRADSDWARGPMYEEAVNAFRTHWDDLKSGSGWQNEYWGKTMLCFAGAAAYTGDSGMKSWILDRTHAFIDEFQKPNGYLSTYFKEDYLRANPESADPEKHWCFNIWGRKYTLWALIELYKTTGDERCLEAARKMGDHLIAQLKRLDTTLDRTGAWSGISSMSILRPIVELHRLTNHAPYRKLADEIVAEFSADKNYPGAIIRNALKKEPIYTWYPGPGLWAKAYELLSCFEGLADYYRLTGEKKVLHGILAFHRHLLAEEMNPMECAGYFDHFWHAANRVNGMTELCDVVHWIRLNRELFALTGEARYMDLIEKAFYNAFLAGVSRDGRWGAHIIRSHGTRHLSAPPQTGMNEHQCCPDNMMRTYFDWAGSLAAVGKDGGLAVLQYCDSSVKLADASVRVRGGYPWADGPVTVSVDSGKPRRLRFRVPSWSKTFSVNGAAVTVKDGWAEVDAPSGRSSWTLAFDLSPRIVRWSARSEQLPPSPQRSKSISDVGQYTVHFMEWYTPEMRGLSRTTPGVRILRGPLVLAKGRVAGTSREETLGATSVRDGAWTVSIARAQAQPENAGASDVWILTLKGPHESEKTVMVSDYATVSNIDSPSNWFSLWF
jgi:DUF1680 family protein